MLRYSRCNSPPCPAHIRTSRHCTAFAPPRGHPTHLRVVVLRGEGGGEGAAEEERV